MPEAYTPEYLEQAREVKEKLDEERGYPYPAAYRPCFGCGCIANQLCGSLPMCPECKEDAEETF